jgi:hypothetical protein
LQEQPGKEQKREEVMKTEAQRFAGRHSMRAAGDPVRLVAAAAVVLLMSAADNTPACADMTIVQQDKTPIVSWPGVGGRILTRVDAGFPLTVLGRDGEWLKVASPELKLSGELWVPVARVGDIAGAPLEFASSPTVSTSAIVPQFRIMANTADGMGTTMPGAAATVGSKVSTGGATSAITRSGSSNATGGAVQATASTTSSSTDVTPETGDPTPAVSGNPTPAPANPVSPLGNPTPAFGGNPTPAVSNNPTPAAGNSVSPVGNPTPAVSNNPTPAISGNPTPAPGNSVSPVGNPTPAMGNPVGAFGTHVATQ